MSEKSVFQDSQYLQKNQYRNSEKLNARAELHRRFSTAGVPWHTWVFDHLELAPGMQILECGCGPGWLWRENVDRIPDGCAITLTDLSPGMVAEAEAALAGSEVDFSFRQANIESLEFGSGRFDVVVANHMLYHVPNLPQALAEVKRVLKANGRFIAATNGDRHMKELPGLIPPPLRQTSASLRLSGVAPQLPFRLENGRELLSPYFSTIDLHLYEDALHITAVEPLLDYAFSMLQPGVAVPETAVTQLRHHWAAKIAADGMIKISKNSGVFVAQLKPLP